MIEIYRDRLSQNADSAKPVMKIKSIWFVRHFESDNSHGLLIEKHNNIFELLPELVLFEITEMKL